MAPDADSDGPQSAAHARIDRQLANRSIDTTPETLYLTSIAVQQARIDALESTVERQEQDLQCVIDRYEYLLAADEPTGEPLTDGGRDTGDDPHSTTRPASGIVDGILARLGRRLR